MVPFFDAFSLQSFPLSPFGALAAAFNPMQLALRQQMLAVDQMLYGTPGLTAEDRVQLTRGQGVAGSVWVALPEGSPGKALVLHEDLAALRVSPGRPVARFVVAGGGGSDWGAAALARVLATHYGEPVGGIVAGYGIRDALGDLMGGVAALNAVNLGLHLHHLAQREAEALASSARGTEIAPSSRAEARDHASLRAASGVLVELLQDAAWPLKSIMGHSKGALAISFAVDALLLAGDMGTLERVRNVDLLSVGLLLALPPVLPNVTQVLGELDGYGAVNSDLSQPHHRIAGAGHHLNTDLPLSLDLADFLRSQQV